MKYLQLYMPEVIEIPIIVETIKGPEQYTLTLPTWTHYVVVDKNGSVFACSDTPFRDPNLEAWFVRVHYTDKMSRVGQLTGTVKNWDVRYNLIDTPQIIFILE